MCRYCIGMGEPESKHVLLRVEKNTCIIHNLMNKAKLVLFIRFLANSGKMYATVMRTGAVFE